MLLNKNLFINNILRGLDTLDLFSYSGNFPIREAPHNNTSTIIINVPSVSRQPDDKSLITLLGKNHAHLLSGLSHALNVCFHNIQNIPSMEGVLNLSVFTLAYCSLETEYIDLLVLCNRFQVRCINYGYDETRYNLASIEVLKQLFKLDKKLLNNLKTYFTEDCRFFKINEYSCYCVYPNLKIAISSAVQIGRNFRFLSPILSRYEGKYVVFLNTYTVNKS